MEERRRGEILKLRRLQAESPDHELEKLYMWIDQIPLSRPKKNLSRDFSDAVMAAELVSHFLPKLVDIHNYPSTFATNQKEYNWFTLTKKVLLKLDLDLTPEVIRAIAKCTPFVMENFLMVLREKLDIYLVRNKRSLQDYGDDIEAVTLLDRNQTGQPHTRSTSDSPHRRSTQNQKYTSSFDVQQTPYSPSWVENPEVQVYRQHHHVEMVPKEVLEEKDRKLCEKTQDVQVLQDKVEKMENWLRLKDRRIEDMTTNIEHMTQELKYQKERQVAVQHGPVHTVMRKQHGHFKAPSQHMKTRESGHVGTHSQHSHATDNGHFQIARQHFKAVDSNHFHMANQHFKT